MLYNQAREWSKLPSEILFVEDWFSAYTVNQAVWNFGQALESALNQVEEKSKNPKETKARKLALLDRWLGKAGPAKQYRDPAASPEGMSKRI